MKNSEKEIMIGQHVDVYWANDDAFYPGVVANRRAQRNFDTLKYFIKYDDGDEGWVDSDEIRILNKSQCKLRQKQRKLLRNRVKKLEVNTRVKVWWPLEKSYFEGTLDCIDGDANIDDKNCKPHHIHYDDGDGEWTNLLWRDFEVCKKKQQKKRQKNKNAIVIRRTSQTQSEKNNLENEMKGKQSRKRNHKSAEIVTPEKKRRVIQEESNDDETKVIENETNFITSKSNNKNDSTQQGHDDLGENKGCIIS